MSAIRIRGQEPGDLEAITEIFNCSGVVAGTLQVPFRSLDWRRAAAAHLPADHHLLVAELDGKVAGTLGLFPEPNPRRRHCAGLGMAVHDGFQRMGIGSALMAAALDLSDNWLGLERLELTAYVDNTAAMHLYAKCGFVVEGTLRAYALRGGIYVDAHTMARVRLRR